MDDHAILGIRHGASIEEIRRAYLRRAKATHPDSTRRDSAEAFQTITAAYRRLSQRRARKREPVRVRVILRPLEFPNFRSVRPTARPALPFDIAAHGARCILGRQHILALASCDIARTIRVIGRDGQLAERSFLIPKGTKHGDHLQYKGSSLKSESKGRLDLQIVYEDRLTRLSHDDV